jgi:ADP-ribosylglycohydrolase
VIADRSAGVVVASAAGDALGAPFEFEPPIDPSTLLTMSGGGLWSAAEWTDDTQMALAILTPLASGDTSAESVERGFLAWFESDPADVGIHTGSVLRRGAPLLAAASEEAERHPDHASNGGLMRIGPAALSFPGDPERVAEYAATVTKLTHAHPDCIDASVLWVVAIDDAVHNAPMGRETWDFAASVTTATKHLPRERRERWRRLIDEATRRPARDFDNNGGAVRAFQAALASCVQTPIPQQLAPCRHLEAAIETAVRCGDDTDTVAAITGALLGARWGVTAVPAKWRAVIHGKRIYGEAELRAPDLDLLARRAARGGQTNGKGWPGVARLVPLYLDEYSQTARTPELRQVRFGNLAGLEQVLREGVDVVISLCRMGTEDVPKSVEHLTVGLVDSEDPADNPNLGFLLADTADFVDMRVKEGRRVYVHCVQAESRTPVLAATYLARHQGLDVPQAIEEVRTLLGPIYNSSFAEALTDAVSS